MNGPVGNALDAFALADEFSEGLRAFHDPGLEWEPSRQFSRRLTSNRAAERQYCRDFLSSLDREAQSSDTLSDPVQVQIARSVTWLELFHLQDGPEYSPDALLQALEAARASAQPAAMYRVLIELGHYWRLVGEEELTQAEWYYKEALAYASTKTPNLEIPRVLYWLGVTFASRSETLPQAVFMFDWASRFGPAQFGSLVEKQKARLRLGERHALLTEAELPSESELGQVAIAIAAMMALRRRRKAICQAAGRGVEISRSQGDTAWEAVFASILKKEGTAG
jgi:hypothetical protein